jgi:outer membrane biosynthesis protein TonB
MEQAIQDAGFSISDTPPTQDAQPTQEAQPVQQAPVEPQQTTAPEPSAPVEQQPVQQQEVQQEAAPVQEQMQAPVQEQSSLQDETQSGLEDFFQALSEAADGPTEQSIEPDTITAQDVDPRIQVIADFVAKTGRSPEDWFRYVHRKIGSAISH